jgi:ABC-type polysaccharide/polyol phosphate export permease
MPGGDATSFAAPGPGHSLSARLRVIGAIMMREIHTRYGRENIGFVWLVLEPIVFAFGVVGLRVIVAPFAEGGGSHGIPLITFLLTGYMPFMLFRHVVSRSLDCVRANTALLYHRQIKTIDLFAARFAIESAGVLLAFWTGIAVCIGAGFIEPPKDLLLVHIGWFFTAWFSMAFGLILGLLNEISKVTERIYNPVGYLLIIVSGCFYMADWLPPDVRQPVLLFNPLLHLFETIRAGFFGAVVRTHQDLAYLTGVCAAMTLFGLALLPIARRHLGAQ